jgi:methionine-rich copper-binding protein CopC
MMRKAIVSALIGLSAATLLGTFAHAHATLTSSNPQANASAASAPTELRLNFSEGVIAKFSGVDLKDESGKPIATGAATVDPKDKKQELSPIFGDGLIGQAATVVG